MTAAVIGLGSWGTAMAAFLAEGGTPVRGWARDPRQRVGLRAERRNQKYLPDLRFPDLLRVEDRLDAALCDAAMIVLAVPSHAVRETARAIRGNVGDALVVNLAKGLEEGTLDRMLDVLAQELGRGARSVSLVGPSHAEEVALGHPTAVVATARRIEDAEAVQRAFSRERFRVYTNADVVGVELAVALKNVIALAAGISSGLGYGDNTLGSLITRGLAEMTRLGRRLGARPETFFGLAGVGDLVTTCGSRHSRNRRLGESVGRGVPLDEAMTALGMVAEGVRTTRAARDLAERTRTEMPIVEQVHAVLFEGKPPREALRDLMLRELKPETGAAGGTA